MDAQKEAEDYIMEAKKKAARLAQCEAYKRPLRTMTRINGKPLTKEQVANGTS